MKKYIISLILGLLILTPLLSAQANAEFNPSYIISDSDVLDYTSMSREEITNFLKEKNGYLARFSQENPETKQMQSAADIIFDRATTNKVNPKFIIVMLQKEMSLIEDDNPKRSQLDWAMGYGCPDGGGCNDRWRGFWKQVNSASMQFYSYVTEPHLYRFKKGETYTFTNPYSTIKNEVNIVTPQNNATAALYNYTPHVYNGNYNFWTIWNRYFSKKYPNGTLLQADGEAGVWLLQGGLKRPFLSMGALTSRFDKNKIVIVSKNDLDSYSRGTPIKYRNYSILRSPAGKLYLLVDEKKREFASTEAFKTIGYNLEEIEDASWEDINSYADGKTITETSAYPSGALLQDSKTGGVYWVFEDEKAPLIHRSFLSTKYKNKTIVPVDPEVLANFKTIDPILFGDGELVKSDNSSSVYLITDNKKRPFASGEIFEKLGYKWENVITTSAKVLYLYDLGDPITGKE